MNGNSFVVDTNVALYLLEGNSTVTQILEDATVYVSFITQLELLGYKKISAEEQLRVKAFLHDCIVVDITSEIKEHTIDIRQKHTIKLPDSIIAATSLFLEIPLLTADKTFKKIQKLDIALYEAD